VRFSTTDSITGYPSNTGNRIEASHRFSNKIFGETPTPAPTSTTLNGTWHITWDIDYAYCGADSNADYAFDLILSDTEEYIGYVSGDIVADGLYGSLETAGIRTGDDFELIYTAMEQARCPGSAGYIKGTLINGAIYGEVIEIPINDSTCCTWHGDFIGLRE